MNIKERILWLSFYSNLLVVFIYLFFSEGSVGIDFDFGSLINLLVFILPIIVLFFHSTLTLGTLRGLLFILLASLTGLIFEIWGLNTGTFFGGEYIYQSNGLQIFDVPVPVICFWAVFIYTGYSFTNSFLYWLNKPKPAIKNKNLLTLLLLILLDGFLVTAIDLFMDPLQVRVGSWIWVEGGPYFGVPIGNFIGWFLVTIIVTGIFRIFEYLFPHEKLHFNDRVFIMPVISYLMIWLSFSISALKMNLISLFLIGSALMLPITIVNLRLFVRWKNIK